MLIYIQKFIRTGNTSYRIFTLLLATILLVITTLYACGFAKIGSVVVDNTMRLQSSPTSRNIYIGEDAVPNIELELLGNKNFRAGEIFNLYDFEGSPIVLNFWFPSCPPCRLEMPHLENSWRKHEKSGVHFIGVQQTGLDSVQDGQDFINEFEITFPIGISKSKNTPIDYNLHGFPTTLFLDSKMKQVARWDGMLSTDKLEELVSLLLK